MTGVDVEVDALIYAQRGSWFVIPGRYYNEDNNLNLDSPMPNYQLPHLDEPLDIRLVINGAIAENRPAPPDAETQWMQHWRGSNLELFHCHRRQPGADRSGHVELESPDPITNQVTWRWQYPLHIEQDRRMGIVYYYDATLARPVCYERDPDDPTIYYYSPRLPKLPVGPNIFSVSAMSGV